VKPIEGNNLALNRWDYRARIPWIFCTRYKKAYSIHTDMGATI